MAQYISKGNIFGRIGSGIGKGLAEQVPKEIANYRGASALEGLEKNERGLSPLQQVAELKRAGLETNEINSYMPFIRNAAISGNANQPRTNRLTGQQFQQNGSPSLTRQYQQQDQGNAGQGMPQQGQPQIEQGRPQAQQGQPQPPKANAPSLKGAGGEAAARGALNVPDPQEADVLARQLMHDDPNLYFGENAYPNAYNRAIDILSLPAKQQAEEVNADTRRGAQQQDVVNKFEKKATAKLPKAVIPGETQQRFLKKAEFDVLNGKSVDAATEDRTNELNLLAKSLLTLRNSIGGRPPMGKAGPQLKKDVATLRPAFEKAGELELFKDEQKLALDIGDHTASLQTWPPTKQQERILVDSSVNDDPQKLAARLGSTVDDDTSLFSLGFMLNKLGVDDSKVINNMNQMAQDGLITFNDRQQREASEYFSLNERPTMGDFLWQSLLGPGGMGLHILFDFISGKKEKVGPVQRLKMGLGKE